jgi:hypothetical protein
MISEKTCPLCNTDFLVGFDPITGVEYPFRSLTALEMDSSSNSLESECKIICSNCYNRIKEFFNDDKKYKIKKEGVLE